MKQAKRIIDVECIIEQMSQLLVLVRRNDKNCSCPAEKFHLPNPYDLGRDTLGYESQADTKIYS
jgi:hypothetical protein